MTKDEQLEIERSIPRDGRYSQYGCYKAKCCDWIKKSNRWKHLVGGCVLGLLLTLFCALGCGGGMEFKDRQWGGSWDWLDFLATCIGGIIGQAAQIGILYLILR